MKGRISEKLEKMLRDPAATAQLKRSLVMNGGVVVFAGRVYRINTEPAPAVSGGPPPRG